MGVMIREWPVKVSFLELTQDIARVQTIVHNSAHVRLSRRVGFPAGGTYL